MYNDCCYWLFACTLTVYIGCLHAQWLCYWLFTFTMAVYIGCLHVQWLLLLAVCNDSFYWLSTCAWCFPSLLGLTGWPPCSGPSEGRSGHPWEPSVGLHPIVFCRPRPSWVLGLGHCSQGASGSGQTGKENDWVHGPRKWLSTWAKKMT